jgi:hypothetical protein
VDWQEDYLSGLQMNIHSSPAPPAGFDFNTTPWGYGLGWHYNNQVYNPNDHDPNHEGDDPTEATDPTSGWNGVAMTDFAVSRYSVSKVFSEGSPYVGICVGFYHFIISPNFEDCIATWPLVTDEFAVVEY